MESKKNWAEIFLLPLVVASVGTVGTYFITQQQQANAKAQADSDRQIKVLEIFAEKITSDDEKQRLLGIKFLRAVDDELAEKLASAVAESEPDASPMQQAAYKVASIAKARVANTPRIYIHIPDYADKPAANKIETVLEKNSWTVPDIQMVGGKSPGKSQLRYFKQAEKVRAAEIKTVLQKAGFDIPLVYISGYENTNVLKPMHFEIWLGSNK